MTIYQLECFIAVAEELNFSAAADTDPHFMMATRYRSSVMFMSSSAWFAVVTVL